MWQSSKAARIKDKMWKDIVTIGLELSEKGDYLYFNLNAIG